MQITVFWVFPHGKFVYFVTRVFHKKIAILLLPTESNGLFRNYVHFMHIIFCVCVFVCLQLKTMVFLVTMGISGKIYILVLPTENKSLFGDYMQVMQMTVFWVFPHEK